MSQPVQWDCARLCSGSQILRALAILTLIFQHIKKNNTCYCKCLDWTYNSWKITSYHGYIIPVLQAIFMLEWGQARHKCTSSLSSSVWHSRPFGQENLFFIPLFPAEHRISSLHFMYFHSPFASWAHRGQTQIHSSFNSINWISTIYTVGMANLYKPDTPYKYIPSFYCLFSKYRF